MSKSFNENRIREIVKEEIEKRITKFDSREPLTREEFLKAIELMNKQFDKVYEGQMLLKVAIDSLGQRSGIRLEKTILKLLQKVLEKRDIDINKIEWIELIDEKGEVFSKNYRTDIDVLIKDSSHILMEIKYNADNRDLFHFIKVAELYTKKYRRPNKLLLLTLEIDPRTLENAQNEKIEVITGDFD